MLTILFVLLLIYVLVNIFVPALDAGPRRALHYVAVGIIIWAILIVLGLVPSPHLHGFRC